MRFSIRAVAAFVLAMVQLAATASIKIPLKSRPRPDHARLPRSEPRSNAPMSPIGLTDWFNRTDNQWYSDVHIGTPPQTLSILWDTGSPFLLLPNNSCPNCGDHRLFDPANSSTFQALQPQTQYNISFVTGADAIPLTEPQGATCVVDADTVTIGSFSVVNQSFLLCNSYAPFMDVQPIDGIIGLGLPGSTSVKSFFWSLWDNGVLPSPVFSFYLPAGNLTGGELILGGIDDSKYTGNLSYTDLSETPNALDLGWVVDQQALYFVAPDKSSSHKRLLLDDNSGRSNAPNGSGWAVLDTGTPFIQTPDNATARGIYAEISPKIQPIGTDGAWGAPCDVLDTFAPYMTFTLGTGEQAKNLTMPNTSFNLGEFPGAPGICQTVFSSPSIPAFSGSGAPVWIMGSPLIKAYYTVWDGVNKTIGWGELAH